VTPYEREFTFTTTGSNQIVALDYPGRCTLDFITIILIGGDGQPITADLFSRNFTGPVIPVFLITTANGNCMLQTNQPLAVKVGDAVVVTNSPTAGYNTTHRIVERIDDFNFVTDHTYTADAVGGSVQLQIPAQEQELYRVTTTMSDNSPLQEDIGEVFKNQDATPNRNIGVVRKIYVRLATAGTYRIALRSHESIGVGGGS
jgi:hypothetical protein